MNIRQRLGAVAAGPAAIAGAGTVGRAGALHAAPRRRKVTVHHGAARTGAMLGRVPAGLFIIDVGPRAWAAARAELSPRRPKRLTTRREVTTGAASGCKLPLERRPIAEEGAGEFIDGVGSTVEVRIGARAGTWLPVLPPSWPVAWPPAWPATCTGPRTGSRRATELTTVGLGSALLGTGAAEGLTGTEAGAELPMIQAAAAGTRLVIGSEHLESAAARAWTGGVSVAA